MIENTKNEFFKKIYADADCAKCVWKNTELYTEKKVYCFFSECEKRKEMFLRIYGKKYSQTRKDNI